MQRISLRKVNKDRLNSTSPVLFSVSSRLSWDALTGRLSTYAAPYKIVTAFSFLFARSDPLIQSEKKLDISNYCEP